MAQRGPHTPTPRPMPIPVPTQEPKIQRSEVDNQNPVAAVLRLVDLVDKHESLIKQLVVAVNALEAAPKKAAPKRKTAAKK